MSMHPVKARDWQTVFLCLPSLVDLHLMSETGANWVAEDHCAATVPHSLPIPSATRLCPLLQNLTYDLRLKCDWLILLAFAESLSHVRDGGIIEGSEVVCSVTLKEYADREVRRGVFYDKLTGHAEQVRRIQELRLDDDDDESFVVDDGLDGKYDVDGEYEPDV